MTRRRGGCRRGLRAHHRAHVIPRRHATWLDCTMARRGRSEGREAAQGGVRESSTFKHSRALEATAGSGWTVGPLLGQFVCKGRKSGERKSGVPAAYELRVSIVYCCNRHLASYIILMAAWLEVTPPYTLILACAGIPREASCAQDVSMLRL